MLIVGSTALDFFRVLKDRVPNDLDIIGTFDEYNWFVKNNPVIENYPLSDKKFYIKLETGRIVDFEVAWENTAASLLLDSCNNGFWKNRCLQPTKHYVYAHPSVVYLLKMSHRYLKNNPHFLKTMRDIQMLRKEGFDREANFWGNDPWMKKREKETYDYKLPNLNQNKNNFFTSNFNYIYDHDTIHEAVKHLEKPAYEYYKGDTKEVFCSKDKFFEVDEKIRFYGVLEESYVLALERSQIPNDFKIDRKKSFEMALEKVCTSITSGWFREFSYNNYDKVIELYDESYVDKFKIALDNGKIKPYVNSKLIQ